MYILHLMHFSMHHSNSNQYTHTHIYGAVGEVVFSVKYGPCGIIYMYVAVK